MLTAGSTSANEGDTVTYSIANGEANTEYTYTISGVDADDITASTLTGTVTTNSSGVATFDVSTVADLATEGVETMVVTIGSTTASVTVNDTSIAPLGDTFALTSSRDIFTSLTTNSDTVTGIYGTLNATDIILDTSTTDSDVLTGTIDGSGAGVAVTIANVETVNLDVRNANGGDGQIDATNFSGVNTLSVDSNYAVADFDVNNLTSGMTVSVDKTSTDLTVDMYLAAGETASNTDALTVSFAGDVTTTLDIDDGTGNDVDALTLHSTGSKKNTVTLSDADDYITTGASEESVTITGDQDIVIKMDQASGADGWDGATVTTNMTDGATSTFEIITGIHASELDLDSVNVDIIKLTGASAGDAANIKVMNNSVIETGAVDIVDNNLTITNATAGGTVTYNAKFSDTNAAKILSFAESGTVNVANAAASGVLTLDAITTSYAGVGNSTDLNVAIGTGLTLTSVAAAASNTLDAVTVTGTGDYAFSTTAASASNSLAVTTEGTVTLESYTAAGDITVSAKVVDFQELLGTVSGSTNLDIDATTTATFDDNLGANGGIVLGNIDINAGTTVTTADTNGTIDANGTLGITAGTSVTLGNQAVNAGATTITAGTTATIGGAITSTGDVSITAVSSDINADITATAKTVTLTGSSATTPSTFQSITAGTVVFNGDGHTFTVDNADDDITANVTVQNGASLVMNSNAGNEIVGNVTHTGSGTVAIKDLEGDYSGADATGAVTIEATSAGADSIITGSGDDSITTGNVEASISAGAGNDTIDASGVTTAGNQVQINGGAGVDQITGGAALDDILTGGTGTDTFYITDVGAGTAQSAYTEKITDFEVGTSGDVLSVTAAGATVALTTDGTLVTMVDTTDASTTTHDNDSVYVMIGKQFADETAMLAAMNDATTGITAPAGVDSVLVVWADTDGNSYVTTADTGAGAFKLGEEVVQLVGLDHTDLAGLTASNFAIA